MQETHSLPEDMYGLSQVIDETKERLSQMEMEIREKDVLITRQQEEKRLTDNHVSNRDDHSDPPGGLRQYERDDHLASGARGINLPCQKKAGKNL